MKRILGIAMVLGLVGALTVMAQEVKPGKGEVKGKSGKAQAKVKPGKVEIIDLSKDVKLEMVLIPAGTFTMGSPASEKGREKDENQHEVTLSKPYYMGKYEVTQEQWFDIMEEHTSSGQKKGRKLPVTDVSWNDCQKFIERLNARTDGGFRLPTEAEWEYACRAGTSTAYSFGDKITSKQANYRGGESTPGKPVAVGSYKPNAFGLYEMHGNVWEWCEDCYEKYPSGKVTDPKGTVTGENRVLRGGSFDFFESSARSAYRYAKFPSYRDQGQRGSWYLYLGFRLARAADIKTTIATTALLAPFTEAKAKEVQKEVAKSLQKEVEYIADLGKSVKLNMVLIPAGKFKMGSPRSEQGRYSEETQHDVTITKPYYMGKYEVTLEQWESVMNKNPSSYKGAKLPVTNVSWEDCQVFIKKLNAKTNGGYRLPTEAEWEYACRAGTSTAHSFGDRLLDGDANFRVSSLKDVGSYKPNAFGLYDMHANVREWCEDWYGSLRKDEATNPMGQATGTSRVLRGGPYTTMTAEKLVLHTGAIRIRPAREATRGFVWRGQNNYCLATSNAFANQVI